MITYGYNRIHEAESFDDDQVLQQFWQHLDERTIPADGLYDHGWRAVSNQAYRGKSSVVQVTLGILMRELDAKIMEDIDRQLLELSSEAAQPGGLTPQRAEFLQLRRDKFIPGILADTLRGRRDFSMIGDFVDEAAVWQFRPPRGKQARAEAPHPVASRRPSHEALLHDYRSIVLQEESAVAHGIQHLQSSVEDDIGIVFGNDSWPVSMTRFPFKDGETMAQVSHRRYIRWG